MCVCIYIYLTSNICDEDSYTWGIERERLCHHVKETSKSISCSGLMLSQKTAVCGGVQSKGNRALH